MDTGAEGQGQSLLVTGFRGSRSQASHQERRLACLIRSVLAQTRNSTQQDVQSFVGVGEKAVGVGWGQGLGSNF